MTKTEMDIRSVLGPAGGSIRPLAAASDLFARRMFEERMDSEDIFLTKDIYPIVAVGGVCIREKVGEFPLKSCQKRSAE